MARGYPDYNNPFYAIASRSADFAQLIALQSGIIPLDSLGRMIFAETFREGLEAWAQYYSFASVKVIPYTGFTEIPPVCLRFQFPDHGAGDNGYIQKAWGQTIVTRWGIEFSILSDAADKDLDVSIEQRIGNAGWKFTVRINTLTRLISVWDGSAWVSFGEVYFETTGIIYQSIKFVVDFGNLTLARLIVGDQRVNVDTQFGGATAYGDLKYYTTLKVLCTTNDGTSSFTHVGHIYVTVDEP